ncbi:MAG: hypothetical protein WCP34_09540 [Pseudomonadota bacterium]
MIHEKNKGMSRSWGVAGLIRVLLVVAASAWIELAASEAAIDVRQDPLWLSQLPPMQWPLPKPSLVELTRTLIPVLPTPVVVKPVEPPVAAEPPVESPVDAVALKSETINPVTKVGDPERQESQQDRSDLHWEVQVWAGHSLSLAKKFRTWFTDRHADLLNGLVVRVEKISAKSRHGHYYKVRVSRMDQRTAAALCDVLESRADQCILVSVL